MSVNVTENLTNVTMLRRITNMTENPINAILLNMTPAYLSMTANLTDATFISVTDNPNNHTLLNMSLYQETHNESDATFLTTTTEQRDTTVLGVVYLVIAVLVMLTNGFTVIVIVRSNELHLPTLWNLAFMAAWDFAYGLAFMIFPVPSALLNRFAYRESVIPVAAVLGVHMTGQNIINVVLAVLDRYICICWPLRYNLIVTGRRFIIATVVSMVLNTARTCIIIFPDMDFYYNRVIAISLTDYDTALGLLPSVLITSVAFGVINFCLTKMILDITQCLRPASERPQRKNMGFTFTIAVTAGVFCLSYVPEVISIMANFIVGKDNVPDALVVFTMLCLESNSLWNVLIYAATYKPFRDAILRMFCKAYYRRQRQIEAQAVVPIDKTKHRHRSINAVHPFPPGSDTQSPIHN